MPCIAGNFDPKLGVYLDVVLIPRILAPKAGELDASDVFPGGVVRPFKAQIDTGAQTTCITKRPIEYYKMTPNGRTNIVSVSEELEVNTYIFTIGFLMGAIPSKIGSKFLGNFALFPPIQGAEIYTDDDDDRDILIGMDVISKGSFHMEATGYFSFLVRLKIKNDISM